LLAILTERRIVKGSGTETIGFGWLEEGGKWYVEEGD